MLCRRPLLAAASGSGSGAATTAWTALKNKFKSKFMIGEDYEPYIPPRREYVGRKAEGTEEENYRSPAPGSQRPPVIPRGYPETEYDVAFFKRPGIKVHSAQGQQQEEGEMARETTDEARLEQLPPTAPASLRKFYEENKDVEWLEQSPERMNPIEKLRLFDKVPHHVPQPSWHYNYEGIKRMRRFYLETGYWLPGCPRFGLSSTEETNYPVEKLPTREAWDQIHTIRDIRIPRLE